MNETEDQNVFELPLDATRIARRTLVLAAVVCCGAINGDGGHAEAEVLHRQILDWLTQMRLWDEVEPSEEKILRTSLGSLTAEETIHAIWYAEGLAILAWALSRFELPKHDEQINPLDVAASVGFLSEDAEQLIETAELRSNVELDSYRELLYAIHVRLRKFARDRQQMNFTSWIDRTWLDILNINVSHLIVQDDLAIGGKVIIDVEDDRWQECELITRERHRAIIWLVDGYPSYSQTPVDT